VNFGFDEDQRALREAAEAFLAKEAGPGFVRAALEDPQAWRPLWAAIVELGWTSLAVPESAGGLGLGVVDLVGLAEVTGRWALPVPFVTSAGLAAPLLAAHPDALAAIAGGAVTTLAVQGPDVFDADPTAGVTWDGRSLRGRKRLVPDAVRADAIAVVAAGADGPVVALVPAGADGLAIEPTHAADPNRPLADLELDVVAPAVAVDPEPGLDVARTVLAAELVGVADRLLGLSVEHATTRTQFDRPIGAFQAVKHRLADLYVAVERARTLTYDAAMVLDDDDSPRGRRALVASLAKAAASEAALTAARTGVQVHGAIGITWEHDVHLFARRARQGAAALGDHLAHYRRAAELHLAGVG
jgi:alkylation response protein AidB-like acyl-CoA dehydrogenase